MKEFSKKDIKRMVVRENAVYKKYDKRDLVLGEGNAFVTPTSSDSGSSNLGSDLSKAKSQNPTDKEFVFNTSSYDNNTSNDSITLDISAKTPTDAASKYNNMMKDPKVKSLVTKGNVLAKVNMTNEELNRLRESSIKFTKKEFNNLFLKK